MPNTLTLSALAENIYKARDIVAREAIGFLNSVTVNGGEEGVSLGGTANSIVTQVPTVNSSITPAMSIPAADDQTIGVEQVVIDQTANVRIPLNGEQFLKLANTAGTQVALDQMIAQALRAITNTIEAHVGVVVKNASSRAVGTAGTTPFASNHNTIASLRQILADNGCPMNDGQLSLILNTSAGTNLRNLANLYKANEAGSTDPLRRGELLNLFGFSIKESAGVASHTKGTGTSYQVNQTGLAAGSTAITVDTGSGTIVAGDIITFASGAGSGHSYVVNSALASNVVTLGKPGLRGAIADNNAITVGNDYTANVGFHRAAVELVLRPPAQPPGGDAAVDSMDVFDPVSGLSFNASLYAGYKMNALDLTVYYKAKVWKSEFVATLLG